MNFSKISKALAGGVTGAITALGGTGAVAVSLPANSPGWEQYLITAIVGFIVGFAGVWIAPADAPS